MYFSEKNIQCIIYIFDNNNIKITNILKFSSNFINIYFSYNY